MLKWLFTLVIALVLFSGLQKSLSRIGLGRLPGDFHLRLRGRDYPIPLASTLLLSACLRYSVTSYSWQILTKCVFNRRDSGSSNRVSNCLGSLRSQRPGNGARVDCAGCVNSIADSDG